MTTFNVLATVDVLSENYLRLLIESYQAFYKEQTPKHQTKISLTLFSHRYFSYNHNGTPLSKLGMNIQVLCASNPAETAQVFKKASILFLPIMESPGPIVKELLICGVPILTHHESLLRKQISKQFILVAGQQSKSAYEVSHAIEDYADLLEMFYFDPGAQKLMKKSAEKKYRRKVNAGGNLVSAIQLDRENPTIRKVTVSA